MLPSQLTPERFNGYPPEAKQAAITHLALLRQLPLAFVPLLLRELIAYDWKFPAERAELDRQLHYLSSLQKEELAKWMAAFVKLNLTPEQDQFDWVNDPATFSERFTAHLWSTHQIDAFHTAAIEYINKLTAATPVDLPVMPRRTIVIVGQGVQENVYPLFRKLRPQGVFYSQVKPDGGNRSLLDAVVARAQEHPIPFGHWYIDGGAPESVSCAELTCLSYQSLDPIRTKLLGTIEAGMRSGNGSEALRTKLARIRPEDLGLSSTGSSAVLDKFGISLLTEGSGTQIFSTTFVQWTAREALRRAQPLTLLARFAPRRHEQSMSEMLSAKNQKITYDAAGSLVDADMGAYYTWINEQRLPGADKSSFLVWFEGHSQALAIAPSLPRGKEQHEPIGLQQILSALT
jgi:hypothetical protein